MEIIKTIQWTAELPGIFALCARMSRLGKADNATPKNFVEFIASYSNCSDKDLLAFADRWLTNNRFKDADVTNYATFSEDRCLFRTHGYHAEALDIVLRYLNTLNEMNKVPALWAYLDQEEKAVVHFVKRQGYYAELYCQSADECSVLHLLKRNGQKYFVPVVFSSMLPEEVISNTKSCGSYHLQDYLPREKFDCLSKGGRKSSGQKHFKSINTGEQPVIHAHDSWDNL